MSNDSTFFRSRAVAERAIATDANLDNVRDRAERAARSWDAMADRAERTDVLRREREARVGTSISA